MHLSVVLVTNLKILYNCLWSSPSPVQNLPLAMAKGWWSLFCFNHHVPDTVHGSCRAGGRCPWGLICSVSPLSSHGSLHVAGTLLQVIILVSKASVPFRSHFFFVPQFVLGPGLLQGQKFSIFWECTQGVSLREAPRTYQNPVLAYHHRMRSLLQVICYKFVSKESTSSEETWKCKWDMSF